jgi:predicted ATPase
MTPATLLTRVVLENYKSIAACDVQLGPLTYLVGPNGAGKSNFCDALEFVRDGLANSLEQAVRVRQGFTSLLHHGAGANACVGIHLELQIPSKSYRASYRLRLGVDAKDPRLPRWEVVEEECRVVSAAQGTQPVCFRVARGQVQASWQANHLPPAGSDRLYLVRVADEEQLHPVFETLTEMCFYRVQPLRIPDIDNYDPQQRLRTDGSNVASVLAVLEATNSITKDRPEEFLRAVLPGLQRVTVNPVVVEGGSGGGRIALVFHQVVGRTIALFGPRQLSEGSLRTLAILAALYQVSPAKHGRPPLTVIEDVEAAIHPAVLGVLRDALVEASASTQVLVTTQSSDLLDNADVATDSVLAVSADNGQTRLAPLDNASRSVLRQRLYTVGELLRIGQLFPEGGPAGSVAATEGLP